MKFVCCFFLLFPFFLHAQSTDRDWGTVTTYANVSDYVGKKFKLEVAIKVQTIDSAGGAGIFARVFNAERKLVSAHNMKEYNVHNSDWVVYTLDGKIGKGASFIWFGGGYNNRGVYYFDNFRLSIETDKNKYKEIPIHNSSFETDSLQQWDFDKRQTKFVVSVTKETAYEGKQALKVDGSGFKNDAYGNNESAGTYALANGIDIYYETYGTGEPLLLLHGNSTSINIFKSQIPELSKHYQVIAVDTRGQGKSGEDGKTYTYDLFAEDMNALMDHLHIESANILGWSDGGNTGLIMAMKYPNRVKKLIAMGAVIFIDNSVVDKEIFKTLNKQLDELKKDNSHEAKNRARLINLLLTEPRHTADELKAIKCPVLVVAGEKDVVKEGHTRLIAEHIPNSTLLIAPGQTHYYPSENPDSFNKAVLEFLEKK